MDEVGETDFEPAAIGVMAQTLWSMVPVVAFVLVQESVDELPVVMEVGDAVMVQEGVPGAVAFGVRIMS